MRKTKIRGYSNAQSHERCFHSTRTRGSHGLTGHDGSLTFVALWVCSMVKMHSRPQGEISEALVFFFFLKKNFDLTISREGNRMLHMLSFGRKRRTPQVDISGSEVLFVALPFVFIYTHPRWRGLIGWIKKIGEAFGLSIWPDTAHVGLWVRFDWIRS